jgi:tRNA pseudouridine55 synthase
LDGVLLIDKPQGMTSHDVVAAVRRALGGVRTGHAGTLDPFATGLLLVLVGRATKSQRQLMELPKRYETLAQLGALSSTGDTEGEITRTGRIPPDPPQLPTGEVRQRPPAYSAVKIEGERAYRRARRGEVVTPAPRPVEIRELEIVEAAVPDLRFRATVSAGTYVRSLARDIGAKLGCGAHLTALRRTAVGPLLLVDAVAPESVSQAALQDAALLVAHLPRRQVDMKEREAVLHGRSIPSDPTASGRRLTAVFAGDELLAVAEPVGELLKPRVVVAADA